MPIKPMIDFPQKEQLQNGQPSFRLMSLVAVARTHWRMARNSDWPQDIVMAHHIVHMLIAEQVEAGLAKIAKGDTVNWSAVANELANEMTTYGMRHAPGSSNGPKEVYAGANIVLAAIGGALIDWAR